MGGRREGETWSEMWERERRGWMQGRVRENGVLRERVERVVEGNRGWIEEEEGQRYRRR